DPTDNRLPTPFAITYREADLRITNLQTPATAASGQTIPVTYTVTNVGNRDTRVSGWSDRIFLSHDASLDNKDTQPLVVGHRGILKEGDPYRVTANVQLPDSIDGDFHLLVYADAAARQDPARHPSDVGFNRIGIIFDAASPLAPWDLVSFATRDLARGDVAEF